MRDAILITVLAATPLLFACGSSATVGDDAGHPAGGAGGAGGVGPGGASSTSTGGAPVAPPSCDQICANIPPGGCSSTVDVSVDCEKQCENVLAAPDRCAGVSDAFLDCIVEQGACTSAAEVCLPQLQAWTECSGKFCGGCIAGGNMAGTFTECSCLGIIETNQSCGAAGLDPCDCVLWGDPWRATTPGGACDWPYEM